MSRAEGESSLTEFSGPIIQCTEASKIHVRDRELTGIAIGSGPGPDPCRDSGPGIQFILEKYAPLSVSDGIILGVLRMSVA